MKFKRGDKVRYIGDWFEKHPICPGKNCFVGATATVMKDSHERQFVQVFWDKDNPLCGEARDGGYYPKDFEVYLPETKFMNEGVISSLEDILEAQELYAKLTA